MPTRIRLTRRGRKRRPIYDIVIADSRAPRDGRYIERIGQFNPNTEPDTIKLDEELAFDWVMKGAQPSERVRSILKTYGVLFRKHVQIGVAKGAITQEEADKKYNDFKEEKSKRVSSLAEKMAAEKQAAIDKADAEAKAKREEKDREKAAAEAALLAEAEAEAKAQEAEAEGSEEADTEEAPAAEAPADEAPAAEEEKSSEEKAE